MKGKNMESFNLNLIEFYRFYDKFCNFELLISTTKGSLKESTIYKSNNREETKNVDTQFLIGKSSLKVEDESNMCVICFENNIQLVLPCLVHIS